MGQTVEVDDSLVEEILQNISTMAKRTYTKLHSFDVNQNNYILEMDVDDPREDTGTRIENKIISREYFDERYDSAKRLFIIMKNDAEENPVDVEP